MKKTIMQWVDGIGHENRWLLQLGFDIVLMMLIGMVLIGILVLLRSPGR